VNTTTNNNTTTVARSATRAKTTTKEKIERGIYRNKITGKIEIQVMVDGERESATMAATTTKTAWRAKHAELTERARKRAEHTGCGTGTVKADADVFFNAWSGRMNSARQLRNTLDVWVRELKPSTKRASVTTEMVGAAMTRFATGPYVKPGRPYSPETRGKLLRTLRLWWEYLDGPTAFNPGRANLAPSVPKPESRSLPWEDAERAILAMRPSMSRARLRLLMFGITPAEILRMSAHDVDWKAGIVTIKARRKGKGSNPRALPFGEFQAFRDALTEFAAYNLWGVPFDVDSLGKCLRPALVKIGITRHVRAYDLRHTCGTEIYRRTGDIHAVQQWLGHTTIQTTMRYIVGGVNERLLVAARAMQSHNVARQARSEMKIAG
jgi:integrase